MEFVLEALIDSAKLLPFLLGAYILIELLETYTSKHLKQSTLRSPYAPLIGAGFGLLPQCGFSVVATDLYSQKKLTMGTLIAIYIATSDEAIPLIIINPGKIAYLIPLLRIKFVYAIILGYSIDLVYKLITKKQSAPHLEAVNEPLVHENEQTEEEHEEHSHIGCCGHHIEEEKNEHWTKRYLLHPALHTLKVFAYILAINLILGGIIELAGGETAFQNFLGSNYALAPLFASIIGLIPNCAGSVAITELFLSQGISFGACLGGLCCNAGIGLVILFKQNKSIKNNIAIVSILFLASLAIGYFMQYIVLL